MIGTLRGIMVLAAASLFVAALAALVLALAGASIGLYLAVRGLGPNTPLDIAYHFALVAVLLFGITVASRIPSNPPVAIR
jgi:hypothetical protein